MRNKRTEEIGWVAPTTGHLSGVVARYFQHLDTWTKCSTGQNAIFKYNLFIEIYYILIEIAAKLIPMGPNW